MNSKLRLTVFSVFLVMGVSLVKCAQVLLDSTKVEIAFGMPLEDPDDQGGDPTEPPPPPEDK